ncbi:MAG: tRNA (adenosine(37)-N6)-threonylcarbamoyltransferase complex dimerization subunit type 1 TsaB [Pseudomonadota bacterium]
MILAFDTAAPHCAAALISAGDVIAEAVEPMRRGQAERLMGLCAEMMAEVGVKYSGLSAIGVGIGPGNFTGIRIAVSAARGLALALDIPAIGVSGFDALRLGQEGPCACAIEAHRGQIYLQGFGNDLLAKSGVYDPAQIPAFEGPLIGHGGIAPRHATANAIARLAAQRCAGPVDPPAPLYLRAADAAPSRNTAPEILP